MKSFCDAFQRNPDGSWLCLEPASIQGPSARLDALPGAVYRRGAAVKDGEVAEFLDAEQHVRAETAAVLSRVVRGKGRATRQ